jgi:DNA polymerase III subunit gamma/tau
MIALTAEGGMRDAESLLTQIASLETSPITEDKVMEVLGTTKKENIATLLRLVANNDLFKSLSFTRQLVQDGVDLSIFCGVFLHYLRDLLLVSANPQNGEKELENMTEEQKAVLLEFAPLFIPTDIVQMLEYLQVAQVNSKTSVIPELPLEIALVKILQARTKNISSFPSSATSETSETTESSTTLPKSPVTPPSTTSLKTSTVSSEKGIKKVIIKEKGQALKIKNQEKSTPTLIAEIKETASAVTTVDLDTVREKWAAILNKAKQLNASLTLALSTARPLQTRGSTIVIAVKYAFHKERLDDKANQLTLADAFDSILGSKIKIAIVLEDTPTIADATSKDLPQMPVQSPENFLENPLINQALDLLGGQLVKES